MPEKLLVSVRLDGIFKVLEAMASGALPESIFSDGPELADTRSYQGIFPVALSLCHLNNTQSVTQVLRKHLVDQLQSQKSSAWTFNYYPRGMSAPDGQIYPDDLDVTCVALAGLTGLDPALLGGQGLAYAVQALTALEIQPGGPYRTWFVDQNAPAAWRDVDPAVNANIAYFLSLHDVRLDGLDAYLADCVAKNKWSSPYYSSSALTAYFFSRGLASPLPQLSAHVAGRLLSRDWPHILDAIFLALAHLNLGGEIIAVEPIVGMVAAVDMADLNRAYAYGIDPQIQGRKNYVGSPMVTLSAAAELLSRYSEQINHGQNLGVRNTNSEIRESTEAVIDTKIAQAPPMLAADIKKLCSAIISRDQTGHVYGNSRTFWQTLGGESSGIPESIATNLDAATVLGWAAYAVYDDILDGDGNAALLPAANWCLRACQNLIAGQIAPGTVWPWSDSLLAQADAANAWEMKNCRFDPNAGPPDVSGFILDENLWADRSLPHAIGPLVLLSRLDKLTGASAQSILGFYRHFILSRQLMDDAHDWEEDLKNGRLTLVTIPLLKRAAISDAPETQSPDASHRLAWLFWTEIVTAVCQKVQFHVQMASGILAGQDYIADPEALVRLLGHASDAAEKTIKEQQDTLAFLASYGR